MRLHLIELCSRSNNVKMCTINMALYTNLYNNTPEYVLRLYNTFLPSKEDKRLTLRGRHAVDPPRAQIALNTEDVVSR